jgi:type IV pilus assembly protein PilE
MLRSLHPAASTRRSGFSLVELTIVVVILGVLSMMAVPRYRTVVEQSKASEAFVYLDQIAKGQEMYNARNGEYSDNLNKLDIKASKPNHFSIGTPTSTDWQTKWEVKLTRSGPSSGYGNYTVTYNEKGFRPGRSSIPQKLRTK